MPSDPCIRRKSGSKPPALQNFPCTLESGSMSHGKRGRMRNLFFLLCTAAALLAIPGYPQTEKPWRQLFNGKDLNGWKHVGPGNMTAENGLIQTHGGMGLLYWTEGKVGDRPVPVASQMRDPIPTSGT